MSDKLLHFAYPIFKIQVVHHGVLWMQVNVAD